MATLDDLKTNLTANNDLKASVGLLINGVADELDKLTHDPVAIKALAVLLKQSAADLGGAVLANTQAPAVPNVPHPTPTGSIVCEGPAKDWNAPTQTPHIPDTPKKHK